MGSSVNTTASTGTALARKLGTGHITIIFIIVILIIVIIVIIISITIIIITISSAALSIIFKDGHHCRNYIP